jgi:hypothetical protein
LSEDTKKREILSEDTLDNVAGGTNDENMQILSALEKIDPDGVQDVYNEAMNAGGDYKAISDIIAVGVVGLVRKNLGAAVFPAYDYNNQYLVEGQNASHSQILEMINTKVAQKDGWEVIE